MNSNLRRSCIFFGKHISSYHTTRRLIRSRMRRSRSHTPGIHLGHHYILRHLGWLKKLKWQGKGYKIRFLSCSNTRAKLIKPMYFTTRAYHVLRNLISWLSKTIATSSRCVHFPCTVRTLIFKCTNTL